MRFGDGNTYGADMQNPHNSTASDFVSPTGARSPEGSSVSGAAAGVARATDETLDENTASAEEGLGSGASTVDREGSGLPGGEAFKGTSHRAPDPLSSTADYLRNNDLKSMMTDAQRLVRNNPGPALLTAAVLGFLVGRTLPRD
jgi:hypothetical protein